VSENILVGKSAHEWFREMVADGLSQRRLRVQEATEFYLVNLLATFLERERLYVEHEDGTVEVEPLAMILLRALSADRRARAQGLRRLGDTALFVSGFFGDSLARSPVSIAELSSLGSNRGLVKLYERFLLTRDGRVAERLRERGVALFGGPGAPRGGLKH